MLVSFELAYILYIESVWSTHCVQHNDMYGISDIKKSQQPKATHKSKCVQWQQRLLTFEGEMVGRGVRLVLDLGYSVFSF